MDCIISETINKSVNKNDFRITDNIRKRITDTMWTIAYYNVNGRDDFVKRQKEKGKTPSEYTGVRQSRDRSRVIQTSVNELIDNDDLFNTFIGKINIERLNKFELCKFNIFNFSSL